MINPMISSRLTGSCDFGVVGGTAVGIATMFGARPSSNLACETEKFWCS